MKNPRNHANDLVRRQRRLLKRTQLRLRKNLSLKLRRLAVRVMAWRGRMMSRRVHLEKRYVIIFNGLHYDEAHFCDRM